MEAAARGANVPLKEAQTLWLAVSKATVVYHLDAEQVKRVWYALIEMMSEGQIRSRQLRRQLATALPIGIIGRFAAQLGVTVLELRKMMKAGLSAAAALPALARAIAGAVPPKELTEAAKAFNSQVNRAKNSVLDLQRVLNKAGYIKVASDAMRAFSSTVNFMKRDFTGIGEVLHTLFASLVAIIGMRLVQAMLKAGTSTRFLTKMLAELKSVLSILGGPTGLIILAAVAFASFIYYASKGANEAKILGKNIRGLTQDIKGLTSAQIQQSIAQLEASLAKLQSRTIAQRQTQLNKTLPLAYFGPGDVKRADTALKARVDHQVQIITSGIARLRARLVVLNKTAPTVTTISGVPTQGTDTKAAPGLSPLEKEAQRVIASSLTPLQRYNAALSRLYVLLKAGLLTQLQFMQAQGKAAIALGHTVMLTKRYNREQEAARQIIVSIATPLQQYNEYIAKTIKEYRDGYLSVEQYNLAVERAKIVLGNARAAAQGATHRMSQFSIRAARSMETAFEHFLFNPFQHGLKGMVIGFANAIRHILAAAAAAKLAKLVMGGFGSGGGGSGWLATGESWLKYALMHRGGVVGGKGPIGFAPAALFVGAPRLHAGGFLGVNEVPAILQRGERVLPVGTSASTGVKIEIINNTGAAVNTQHSREGHVDVTRIMIGTISTDIHRGGEVARAISQVFGVQRVGARHG